MANRKSLPKTIEFPCQFCCKPMAFDKQIFIKGGMVKCKSCGMITKFQPHKNAGRHKAKRNRWVGGDPNAYSGT